MKKYLFNICMGLILATSISAQNVVVTSASSDVDGINERRLIKILSSVAEYHGTTPIELRVSITEGKSETIRGLENRSVTTADLNIQAFDFLTEQHLGSKDIVLTGSGSTVQNSNKELLKKLKSKKNKISTWLVGLDTGIVDCVLLQKRVQSLITTSTYDQAYILANNPNCQEGSYELKEKIIAAYQKQTCETDLRKAEALVAIKKYDKAIDHILNIDPDANCGDAVVKLIDQIKIEYTKDYNDSFEFYLKYLEKEESTRKERALLFDIILLNKLIDE